MWRTISTPISEDWVSSLPPRNLSFSLKALPTILTVTPESHTLYVPKALIFCTIDAPSVSSIPGLGIRGLGSNFGLIVVRCISSDSPAPTLDWNDPVSCSEVSKGDNGSVEVDTSALYSCQRLVLLLYQCVRRLMEHQFYSANIAKD